MSYENAPATKLLATHCFLCGKALVDAISVETGIGPICRENAGYGEVDCSSDERKQANTYVHQLARSGATFADLLVGVAGLKILGFTRLAGLIVKRSAVVKMTNSGGGMVEIETPYNPEFVATIKSACPWKCRTWNAERKTWSVLMTKDVRAALWASMRRCWPNSAGVSPDGELFEIPPARSTVAV